MTKVTYKVYTDRYMRESEVMSRHTVTDESHPVTVRHFREFNMLKPGKYPSYGIEVVEVVEE